jgi:2,3,4,5-tetrahydropyridine-2-carboxylate N-succinyltransferase
MTLDPAIDELWERRESLGPADGDARAIVTLAIDALDAGTHRVAWVDPDTDAVVVDQRAKRAILLSFRLMATELIDVGPFHYADKLPLTVRLDGVRVVPGAIARWGSFHAPGVILMPSYTNIGGYVDEGTLVDTWATVGSCAQVGKRVHLSGGVGLGGVLEPMQAAPVVVEDDAFLGSRSIVVEGARVRTGAKLGAGTTLTSSTPVIDVTTGTELARGEAPAWSVCVNGTRMRTFPAGDFGLSCVLVLRRLEPGQEHDKLLLNDVLREHGIAP